MNKEPVGYVYSVAGEPIKSAKINPEIPNGTPLYTHPAKHLSLQKVDGELVAVTYTDDEHRIVEVLWERPPAKTLTDEDLIESLAELEHKQWMKWADTIMQTEKISDDRFARWTGCMIPYADLSEEMKEFDREWARKALAILRKAQEK